MLKGFDASTNRAFLVDQKTMSMEKRSCGVHEYLQRKKNSDVFVMNFESSETWRRKGIVVLHL